MIVFFFLSFFLLDKSVVSLTIKCGLEFIMKYTVFSEIDLFL